MSPGHVAICGAAFEGYVGTDFFDCNGTPVQQDTDGRDLCADVVQFTS